MPTRFSYVRFVNITLFVACISFMAFTAENLSLAQIQCTQQSPMAASVWDQRGQPHVNMTHIFCGQINGTKAEGFHYRTNDLDPPSAQTRDYDPNSVPPFARGVSVWNANTRQWVIKSLPSGKDHFFFFPTSDFPSQNNLVIALRKGYLQCGNIGPNINTLCLQKGKWSGQQLNYDTNIFLTKEPNRRIISAFPDRSGTCRASPTVMVCSR